MKPKCMENLQVNLIKLFLFTLYSKVKDLENALQTHRTNNFKIRKNPL